MGKELQSRGDMRPSDQSRERAAQALRAHYAQGRIDDRELERRVGRAYAATTRSDLRELFRDLPWDPRTRARSEGFWQFQRELLRAHGIAYVGINALLVGIWAATGQGEFWPAGSIAGWGAVFGGHWGVARAIKRSRRERRGLAARPRRALGR